MMRLAVGRPTPLAVEPRTTIRRSVVHVPSPELHTTIARGFGFRAIASDGWKGPNRKTYADARKDARLHKLEAVLEAEHDAVSTTEGKAG